MQNSLDAQLNEKNPSTELYEQQIHDLRNQLSVLQMMEQEYTTEIEVLQKKYEDDITAEKAKQKALEEKNMLSVEVLLSKIASLEQNKCDNECYQKTNLDLEKKLKKMEEEMENLANTDNKELLELQCANNELKEKVSQYSEECLRLQEQFAACSSREEDLNNNLREFKELYLAQKEELASKEENLMLLRDELASLKSELNILKSKPRDGNEKGNSLFSEVEDKRQSMKKSLENSIIKYRKMKKQYLEKCTEATKFREDYVFLTNKCSEIETDLKEEDKCLINSYTSRIKFLVEEVEQLQKKSPYVITNADKDAHKHLEAYAEFCRKQTEKVKSELEAAHVKALFSSQTLYDVQRKLHRSEIELIQARGQITYLQGLLKEKEEEISDDNQQLSPA